LLWLGFVGLERGEREKAFPTPLSSFNASELEQAGCAGSFEGRRRFWVEKPMREESAAMWLLPSPFPLRQHSGFDRN